MSVPPLVRRALVWVLVTLIAAAAPLAGDAAAEEPSSGPPLEVQDTQGHEQDGFLSFTIVLGEAATDDVTARWDITGGDASADDFVATSGTITIDAGSSEGWLFVRVVDDSIDEADETFDLVLSEVTNAEPVDATAQGTIFDDDRPVMYMSDGFTTEKNGVIAYPVRTRTPASRPITFTFATRSGTADESDFVPTTGTATIAPGEIVVIIPISILDDAIDEPDETFEIVVSDVVGAEVWDTVGSITIRDNDDPPVVPDVSVSDVEAFEDDGVITFTISLSEPTTVPVTVDYTTADSTSPYGARHGRDFLMTSGTATFEPGATTVEVDVPLVDDLVPEWPENLRFLLTSAAGGTIVDQRATGTINDDDPIRLGSLR